MRASVNSACTVHNTSYLGMYVHTSVDRTRARSSCTVSIQQLTLHEISVCLYVCSIHNSRTCVARGTSGLIQVEVVCPGLSLVCDFAVLCFGSVYRRELRLFH